MNGDSELETWSEVWKSPGETSEQPRIFDIHRELRRKEFRLKGLHLLEIVGALLLLVFSYVVARRHPSTEMLLWAMVIWAVTLVATAYSLWTWRMLWAAEKKPACEYAQIYERYCVAGLRQIRFGYHILVVNLAIVVPWISWRFVRLARANQFSLTAFLISVGLIAGLTGGYLFWFSWSRRNRLHELEQLRQYRKSLDEEM